MCRRQRAFTLVEMLAVMGIIIVLLALIVPAATQIMRGSNLTQSGESIGDQLVLARQLAMSNNRRVQVRFYSLPTTAAATTTNFCAMQTFRVEDSGLTAALTKLQALHTGVIFASDNTPHSTLLVPPSTATLSVSGSDKLPAYWNKACKYVGFQFLPDGSTDLDPTVNWFITVVDANKAVPATGSPTNFYTVRVDPVGGHVQSFRP